MKLSLRGKLFAALSGLVLFFVVLSWLLNSLFLDKYYFIKKKNALMESYRLVNSLYQGDPEEISLELERLERTQGMYIVIQDQNFETKYTSVLKRRMVPPKPPVRNVPHDIENLLEWIVKSRISEIEKGGKIFENRKDKRLNSNQGFLLRCHCRRSLENE